MLIIPAIDLKDGKCVRLKQGRMEDSTVFSANPLDMARRWYNKGARRLHMVDLNGAFAGKPVNADAVYSIVRELPDLAIQLGGGIRDNKTIRTYLDSGVSYVIIGTKALEQPEFVAAGCQLFPGKIMVGIDARDGIVATDGWAKTSNIRAADLARQFEQDGVQALIYTDINRDGMMQGVNVDATLNLAQSIKTPVIASGGISSMDDIRALTEVAGFGITGAITGRAIYEGTLDFTEAQQYADGS